MNSLDRKLELLGAHEPDAAIVDEAQRKLETLVAERSVPKPARRAQGWLAAGATAAVVAVAMLWLPFGSTPAVAFSKVQQHFKDFHTMRFEFDQRMDGQLLMTSRVSVRQDGSVRAEVGDDIVVIVNSQEKQILTLVKDSRMAVVSPLDGAPSKDDSLKWLDDVRNFQGQAKALPGSRIIDGQRAQGFELPIEGGKLVLWANADGLPLSMTLEQQSKLEMNFHFEFDPPLDAQLFSTAVPEGYSRGESED